MGGREQTFTLTASVASEVVDLRTSWPLVLSAGHSRSFAVGWVPTTRVVWADGRNHLNHLVESGWWACSPLQQIRGSPWARLSFPGCSALGGGRLGAHVFLLRLRFFVPRAFLLGRGLCGGSVSSPPLPCCGPSHWAGELRHSGLWCRMPIGDCPIDTVSYKSHIYTASVMFQLV